MATPRSPREVLPQTVAAALGDSPYWFVIGGQAVRCFCPYRPSRDVDFGVLTAKDMQGLVRQLRRKGSVQLIEKASDTVHLNFDGIDVSVFVLPNLKDFTSGNTLSLRGLLATKLHAILDRGMRRDFFDVYVLLNVHKLGLTDCITALDELYETEVNQGLLLRALTYFEDANSEAPLPGEGEGDWDAVRDYFSSAVAAILIPPRRRLSIQSRVVDVMKQPRTAKRTRTQSKRRPS